MAENHLKHLAEFQKLLKDYSPRAEFIEALQKMELVLLTSPAATGKNTILNYLVSTKGYQHVVSDTTRKPRINDGVPEVDGKEYWFRSEEELLRGLKRGDYVTPAIIHEQQVSGISFSELMKIKKQHKIAIAEVNIDGARHLNEYCDAARLIFLIPPNYEEWLRRLESRGQLNFEEKVRRLRSARIEIEYALNVDFFTFMINEDVGVTSQNIHDLLVSHKSNNDHGAAREHALALLDRLEKELI